MVTTYHKWKGHGKEILYNYPEAKEQIKELENDVYYGGGNYYDGQYRRGGVSNPTLGRALKLSTGRIVELRREVAAVESIIQDLSASGDELDALKLKLLQMVYFKATHDIRQAAIKLHISESAAYNYNGAVLTLLALRMGWI